MPVAKMKPEELDWAKKVYKTLHWNFPAANNDTAGSAAHEAQAHTLHNEQSAPPPEPDLSDYVVIDEPERETQNGRPSPVHRVMADIGLPETEGFRERLDSYQAKFNAFQDDPVAAAYADPQARVWEGRVTGVLGQSQTKADKMVIEQFKTNMKQESREITKEILETQADDPKFQDFLKEASSIDPHELKKAHKEMLVFMSQNLKTIGNELVGATNDLQHQHAFGKSMSDVIDTARTNAVSQDEHDMLDQLEEEVIAYRMAVARQLGMALNTTNDVQAAMSFGATVEATFRELAPETQKANYAVGTLGKMADAAVHKHLAKSNSAKTTMKWAEKQPWSKLVKVTIDSQGGYFNIVVEPRHAPETDDAYADGSINMPHKELTKNDVHTQPELIYNGLRSPEMMQALSLKPTGQQNADGLPIVGKPNELSLEWGNALADALAHGEDIQGQLPDYLELKQVQYEDVKKGFFSSTKVNKTAWVVEQKEMSETIAEVNLMKQLPRSIAGDLADMCENMSDLKKDQQEKLDEILDRKHKLEEFVATEGGGLFKAYGKAHDAISNLQSHVSDLVKEKIQSGTSPKKIMKWAKEQPWSPMFDVQLSPCETGGYNILVEDKQHDDVADLKDTAAAPGDTKANPEQDPGADEVDLSYGENMHGLNGALRALLNPSVYKHLISKPTEEPAVNGIPIVEEPTKFARDWADLMLKTAGGSLPDYLEIREVQYRKKSFLFWKNNKLEVCKVLEFKPSAFKRHQRRK